MAIIDEPQVGSEDSLDAEESLPIRRRRWPWVVAGVVAISLIAGFVGFSVWAAHYQPLTMGTTGSGGADISPPGSIMTPRDYWIAQTSHPNVVIAPKAGQSFEWFQSMANRGRFGVTVTNVYTDGGNGAAVEMPFYRDHPYVWPSDLNGVSYEHGTPLTAQSFPTNTQLGLRMVERIPRCATVPADVGNGGYSEVDIDSYHVTYKFLWFTHTTTLPLTAPIAIINIPTCPVK